MAESNINRRRGRPRSQSTGPPKFFICLAAVIFILFVITWFIITQKTTKSIHDIADATAEARNLGTNVKLPLKNSAPGTSLVECKLNTPYSEGPKGVLTITVRHDLSPLASGVFIDLVKARWWDGVFIFRFHAGFVAQWGIRHKELGEMDVKADKTKDEVTEKTLSNVEGTLSFAGGNPATKQVFVNVGDNRRLDKENSRPFATVDDVSMELLRNLYTGYKEGQGQVKAMAEGEDIIRAKFPNWSQIERCQVISEFEGKATKA